MRDCVTRRIWFFFILFRLPVIVVTNSNAINTFSINDIPNNSFGNLSTRLHIDFSICFTHKPQLSVSITRIQMNAGRHAPIFLFLNIYFTIIAALYHFLLNNIYNIFMQTHTLYTHIYIILKLDENSKNIHYLHIYYTDLYIEEWIKWKFIANSCTFSFLFFLKQYKLSMHVYELNLKCGLEISLVGRR